MASVKGNKSEDNMAKEEIEANSAKSRKEGEEPSTDKRIFEADSDEPALNAEEQIEIDEFNETLRKYNAISREMLKEALEEEKKELISSAKSPKNKYFEESKDERILNLNKTTEIIKERQKLAEQKKKVKV